MKYAVTTAFVGGFSLIVGLFLLATATTVWSVSTIRTLDSELAALDHAKHQGHLTLADIQQQYIHQIHTLVLKDRSHLGHYAEARIATERRLELLDASCTAIGVDEGLDAIGTIVEEMDRYFTINVVPGLADDSVFADVKYHDHLDQLTIQARGLVATLNSLLESKSARARGDLERVLIRTRLGTLGTLSIAAVAAVAVGLLLARLMVRPLASLRQAFGNVSAGQLETRVRVWGPHELRELASGFNEMAAALIRMRESVEQNERMAVMGELAAGVAHELNNPLGVIKGYLKIVRRESGEGQLSGDLDVIEEEVQKCQEIIQGLTELARPRHVRLEDTDLAALAQDTVERMEAARGDPVAQVEVVLPPGPVRVATDPLALGRVIANLLNNALDAAGPEGQVEVAVGREGENATFTISDSGHGIPPEIQGDLFKPFKTTKEAGVGLGLAITLAIIRSHGGRIETGRGSFGGACFKVILPFAVSGGADAGEGA